MSGLTKGCVFFELARWSRKVDKFLPVVVGYSSTVITGYFFSPVIIGFIADSSSLFSRSDALCRKVYFQEYELSTIWQRSCTTETVNHWRVDLLSNHWRTCYVVVSFLRHACRVA